MTVTAYHKPVLVNLEFMDNVTLRTAHGRLVVIRWGEPDADGVFDPVFTEVDDGYVLVKREVFEELERRSA